MYRLFLYILIFSSNCMAVPFQKEIQATLETALKKQNVEEVLSSGFDHTQEENEKIEYLGDRNAIPEDNSKKNSDDSRTNLPVQEIRSMSSRDFFNNTSRNRNKSDKLGEESEFFIHPPRVEPHW